MSVNRSRVFIHFFFYFFYVQSAGYTGPDPLCVLWDCGCEKNRVGSFLVVGGPTSSTSIFLWTLSFPSSGIEDCPWLVPDVELQCPESIVKPKDSIRSIAQIQGIAQAQRTVIRMLFASTRCPTLLLCFCEAFDVAFLPKTRATLATRGASQIAAIPLVPSIRLLVVSLNRENKGSNTVFGSCL